MCSDAESTLKKAVRVGELLSNARDKIKKGDWTDWIESTLPFSKSTADNYIRVFGNRERLREIENVTEAYAKIAPKNLSGSKSRQARVTVTRGSTANQQVTTQTSSKNETDANSELVSVANSRNNGSASRVEIDKVGRPVPEELLSLWQDHLAQELLTHLSHVKAALERLMKSPPVHWWEVNLSGTLIDLNKVWSAVECAKPYAVCPYCQGSNRKNCVRCKSWGFVSEYRWKTAVTKDMKELNVKGVRK